MIVSEVWKRINLLDLVTLICAFQVLDYMFASCLSNVLIYLEVWRKIMTVYMISIIQASVKVRSQDLNPPRLCEYGRKWDIGNKVGFGLVTLFFSYLYQCNPTWMWGKFGQFCCFCRKLPHCTLEKIIVKCQVLRARVHWILGVQGAVQNNRASPPYISWNIANVFALQFLPWISNYRRPLSCQTSLIRFDLPWSSKEL